MFPSSVFVVLYCSIWSMWSFSRTWYEYGANIFFFFFNMSTHWSPYQLLKIPSFSLCFEIPPLSCANLGLFQNILFYLISLCVSSYSSILLMLRLCSMF